MNGGNKLSQSYYKVFSKRTFHYNKTTKKVPLSNALIMNGFNIMLPYTFATYKLIASYKMHMTR